MPVVVLRNPGTWHHGDPCSWHFCFNCVDDVSQNFFACFPSQIYSHRAMRAEHQKLLELGAMLDTHHAMFDAAKPYDQRKFFHDCGAPSCAVGLWAHLHLSTWDRYRGPFKATPYPALIGLDAFVTAELRTEASRAGMVSVRTVWSGMLEFGLTWSEAVAIFGFNGCDGAQSEADASRYIHGLVETHQAKVR